MRMGRSKALLATPTGHTFVAQLVDTLSIGGNQSPFVVGRPDDEPLKLEVESLGSRARWVENHDADTGGQLSSLLAGLDKADRPGVRGLMVNRCRCSDDYAANGHNAALDFHIPRRIDRSSALSGTSRTSCGVRARSVRRPSARGPGDGCEGCASGSQPGDCRCRCGRCRRCRRHRYARRLPQARAMMFTASASPRRRRLRPWPDQTRTGRSRFEGHNNMKRITFVIVGALIAAIPAYSKITAQTKATPDIAATEWPTYGHDSGGMRFSPLTESRRRTSPTCRSRGCTTCVRPQRPGGGRGARRSGRAADGGRGGSGFTSERSDAARRRRPDVHHRRPTAASSRSTRRPARKCGSSQPAASNPPRAASSTGLGDAQTPPQIVFGTTDGKLHSVEREDRRAQCGLWHGWLHRHEHARDSQGRRARTGSVRRRPCTRT